ncbi:hypothetical protein HY745_02190 [Candidatus Desantisbacteria bacterium]|nr:hypothetical protein [Candidatus Desantisbacteria bacterium]
MQSKMKFLTPDEAKKIIEYLSITRAKNDDIVDEIEIMDNAMKKGEKLFNDISLGNNGKSCGSCHNDKQNSLRKKAFIYPKYFNKAKKLVNLEQRINYCIMNFMEGEALKLGSDEIIILTMYLYSLL